MLKKSLIFIVVMLIALGVVPAFSACGEEIAVRSEISDEHELTDLYHNGEITLNDLKNIAALRVGYVAIVESEEQFVEDYRRIEFEPTLPEPLPDSIKQSIEQDFKSASSYEVTSFTLRGYGKYGDYFVVEIGYRLKDVDFPTDIRSLTIANIFLGYFGRPSRLLAWKAV